MDYGDEFNDDEERRYKEETYGIGGKKKKVAKDAGEGESGNGKDDSEEEEDGEDEEDGEESFEEVVNVVPLAKDFSKRANRGTRMTQLVGKALDEDDDFWGGAGADLFGKIGKLEGGEDGEANLDD